jgi:hypothetical protein
LRCSGQREAGARVSAIPRTPRCARGRWLPGPLVPGSNVPGTTHPLCVRHELCACLGGCLVADAALQVRVEARPAALLAQLPGG